MSSDANQPIDNTTFTWCRNPTCRKQRVIDNPSPSQGRPFEICMACEHRVFKA